VDLLPRAGKEYHVVTCRCGEDPFGKLRSALLGEHYEAGRKYGKPVLKDALESAARQPNDGASRPLLVCIDQFEELFGTVPDKVRRQFFEALRDGIEGGKLRLLVAIRTDFYDLLLKGCRDVDPANTAFAIDRASYCTMRPFSAEDGQAVLGRMLDRDDVHAGDPLRRAEVGEFACALVQELLRPPLDRRICPEDEKRVLPVEVQMTGWTYESILGRRFAAAGLRRQGGKAGLYRAYIEDAKEYVFRRTGVAGATSLGVLRRMIGPAGIKQPQSVREIAAAGLGVSVEQADTVLRAFEERYLVRLLPHEGAGAPDRDIGSRRYELMHEHLVQLLKEAPDPENQRAVDAEARLLFWLERTRYVFAPDAPSGGTDRFSLRSLWRWFRSLFTQPIPLSEMLRLWRYASDRGTRQMLRRNLSGLVATLVVVLMILGAISSSGLVYVRSDAYQASYVIKHAPAVGDVNRYREDSPLGEWLRALVAEGRTDNAMTTAGRVSDPSAQSWAYAVVAEAAARAGQADVAKTAFDDALTAAGKATSPDSQSWAYAAVAEAAARAGQADVAKKAIDDALTAATGVVPEAQPLAYATVARVAARAGQIGAALIAAEQISPDRRERSAARACVAQAFAHAGRLYDARIYCHDCEGLDKLTAYAAILTEYTKRYGPSGASK
jgi:hypothetical protein